jgi:hypothetical protein
MYIYVESQPAPYCERKKIYKKKYMQQTLSGDAYSPRPSATEGEKPT